MASESANCTNTWGFIKQLILFNPNDAFCPQIGKISAEFRKIPLTVLHSEPTRRSSNPSAILYP